jgi:hypothetical protein
MAAPFRCGAPAMNRARSFCDAHVEQSGLERRAQLRRSFE